MKSMYKKFYFFKLQNVYLFIPNLQRFASDAVQNG
jgi:hypothetical protein